MPADIMTLETSRNVNVTSMVEESSNVQVLSNVARIAHLGDLRESEGKPIASLQLIFDADDKDAEPFIAVQIHNTSGETKDKQRAENLKAINEAIFAARDAIFNKTGKWVNRVVAFGDYNVNYLEELKAEANKAAHTTKAKVNEKNLEKTLTPLGEGMCVVDMALAEGLEDKRRGKKGQLFNFLANGQLDKEQIEVESDSKCAIFEFEIDGPANTDELKKKQLAHLVKKQNDFFSKTAIPKLDFVDDKPTNPLWNYIDHFGTKMLKIGRVLINGGSYLPTAGLKGVKHPADIYKVDVLARPNFDTFVEDRQLEFCESLYRSVYAMINKLRREVDSTLPDLIFNKEEWSNETGIRNASRALDAQLREVTQKLGKDRVLTVWQDMMLEWMNSDKYKQVEELTHETKPAGRPNAITQKMVYTNMVKLCEAREEPDEKDVSKTKMVPSALEKDIFDQLKKSDFEAFAKFFQKVAQAQKKEAFGGYSKINNEAGAFPGPDAVDDAHVNITTHQVSVNDAQHVYLRYDTESGTRGQFANKPENFKAKIDKAAEGLVLQGWLLKLKKAEARSKNLIEDKLFPSKKAVREDVIADLSRSLRLYVEEKDAHRKMLKGVGILGQIRLAKPTVDLTMQRCLTEIAFQVQLQLENNNKPKNQLYTLDGPNELTVDFLVTEHEEVKKDATALKAKLAIWKEVDNNQPFVLKMLATYAKIENIKKYAKTLPEPKSGQCQRLCQDMTKAVNSLVTTYEERGRKPLSKIVLDDFTNKFTVIAHSQDEAMSADRHWYSMIADIVFALVYGPTYHLLVGGLSYMKTGTVNVGLFHRQTKSMALIDDVVAMIPSIQTQP